jgi:hypothetical protein
MLALNPSPKQNAIKIIENQIGVAQVLGFVGQLPAA